jgi:hypothetical protein
VLETALTNPVLGQLRVVHRRLEQIQDCAYEYRHAKSSNSSSIGVSNALPDLRETRPVLETQDGGGIVGPRSAGRAMAESDIDCLNARHGPTR